MEYITNYNYRHRWVKGVDKFEYNENEVTRLGSEHVCVINGKHLDFVAVTKDVEIGQLIYGEMTTSPPPVDAVYQFYIIDQISESRCKLKMENYWEAKSPLKRLAIALFVRRIFRKNTKEALEGLHRFVAQQKAD